MNWAQKIGHKKEGRGKREEGNKKSQTAGSRAQAAGINPYILLLVAALALFVFCPQVNAQVLPKKFFQSPMEKRIGDIEKDVLRLERQVDIYNLDALPDYLMLCDKKIPIFREDVRERFERELFLILENKGLLTTIVKRYFKYLPMINEEIQKQSLPSDLVFLAVTESYLNPRAVSSASAAGIWQFIKETGKREGLSINDDIDERYNIKKSTQSALTHLKRLYGEFNDWLIVMAAYNAGAARLKEAIENQNTKDFFDLYLPEETERYVLRVVAIKEIISNRERYGIKIDEKELYKQIVIQEITLQTEKEIHSNILAKAMEVSYRTFRMYNLHIRKYRMPKGAYRINVPVEKKDIFIKHLQDYDYIRVY